MSTIKDMNDLREHCLETLDLLRDRKIVIKEASAVAKMASSIIAGIRAQQEYAYALHHQPKIPFNGDCLGEKIRD